MIFMVLPDVTHDDRLLALAQSGDKAAISQIYTQYAEPVYQFCRLRLGNPQQAEDITSSVFTKMIQAFAKGKGPRQHLRGWLFKVARNEIYDSYGQTKILPLETIEQWAESASSNPELLAMNLANLDTLRDAIQQLSPGQQDVILLRFDQQLSVRECADILGKSPNTIKVLQFRAVRRLRDMLQRAGVQTL